MFKTSSKCLLKEETLNKKVEAICIKILKVHNHSEYGRMKLCFHIKCKIPGYIDILQLNLNNIGRQ